MTLTFDARQPPHPSGGDQGGGITPLPAYQLGPPRPPGEPFPFLKHRTMAEMRTPRKREGGV